jgi:integrase
MSLAARSVPFGSKPMKQVRRSDVEAWIKSMHAAGLAPGTIKTRYVNVRSVFRAAVKDKVIGSDPTDGVRLPRNRRADVAMSIPTPQEVGQLIAVADERFQPFIALCVRRPAAGRGRRDPARRRRLPPQVAQGLPPGAARQWRGDRAASRPERPYVAY